MGNCKLGIAAGAAILGLALAGRGLMGGGENSLPGPFYFVDVESGRVFEEFPGAFSALPAKNKRNGQLTIYPVAKVADGRYEVPEKHRELLEQLAQTMQVKVDLETFRIEP